jgi:hypothetical protein
MKAEKAVNIFVKFCVGCLIVIAGLAVAHRAFAQRGVMICEPDRNGKLCCWDTSIYGPNRPFICN